MATAREATSGTQDLSDFQRVIQQQEEIFGPLISLSNDGVNNIMTFQIGPRPDAEHLVIIDTYIDHPPLKNGFVLVCISNCLVSGTIQSVGAYRKKS